MLEKLGAVIGVSNLHIYAAMRGQSLEDFQKTRNSQVLYSVAGKDAGTLAWEPATPAGDSPAARLGYIATRVMSEPLTGVSSMATRHALRRPLPRVRSERRRAGSLRIGRRRRRGAAGSLRRGGRPRRAGGRRDRCARGDGRTSCADSRARDHRVERRDRGAARRAASRCLARRRRCARAVLAAPRIGYSTGPSGTALLQLFARWGIAEKVQARLVQAPPGKPVAALLAAGEADIGFQQQSELQGEAGVVVLGPMPPGVEIVTTFVGAVGARSARIDAARAVLEFLRSPANDEIKRRHGMAPVRQDTVHRPTSTASR